MTIKEVREICADQYVEIEFYTRENVNYNHGWHGDFLKCVDEYDISEDTQVDDWELMDEEKYGNSIIANGDITADFNDWYGDKNAQVLCIIIKENFDNKEYFL